MTKTLKTPSPHMKVTRKNRLRIATHEGVQNRNLTLIHLILNHLTLIHLGLMRLIKHNFKHFIVARSEDHVGGRLSTAASESFLSYT